MAGGGSVPLSHAICCRHCLPEELPPDLAQQVGVDNKPIAILSYGPHQSTNPLPQKLRCEVAGGNMVHGFEEALAVSATVDKYYPVNAALCSNPSLLLLSGQAIPLERCDCILSRDVNCGGTSTHRLLYGFIQFRVARGGALVPVAPAQCCKACLPLKLPPAESCQALSNCNNNGICVMGACECIEGWMGADCSQRDNGNGDVLPQWLLSLIILASTGTLCLLLFVVGRILRIYRESNGGEEGHPLTEPLLLRIDGDEGSVGSEDTTDDEDECTADDEPAGSHVEMPQRRPGPTAPEPTSSGDEPGAQGAGVPLEVRSRHNVAAEEVASADPHADASDADGEDSGSDDEIREAHHIPTDHPHPPPDANHPLDKEEVSKEEEEVHCDAGDGLLTAVDCSVCMCRPVQVVVIPCGHACMCRRCSRRLSRCPICRKEIVRRQRLFLGG